MRIEFKSLLLLKSNPSDYPTELEVGLGIAIHVALSLLPSLPSLCNVARPRFNLGRAGRENGVGLQARRMLVLQVLIVPLCCASDLLVHGRLRV
jgi:hypothetical protein